ncbi:MAG TPA: radical SAM protein, partial [Promineifilum sp.]|nr:radical SAM protein [Promineifilum sp.]
RLHLPEPDRAGLPDLSNYARYLENEHYSLSGYVEASRGCLHTCAHCPVVPVYGGRFFIVPFETVMADIRAQVAAGAEHITFGDPDFLNGPGHALKLARAIHDEFPALTFDFTTKVEHILQHRALMPEFRALGASFVISAFESTSDNVLKRLRKGHTRADMDEALAIMEAARLPVQSTWLPFTPWTTLDDYIDMLAWIRERDLIGHVPAVQLSIRLLVPPNSILLEDSPAGLFDHLDAANFSHAWRHPDPRMDELQARVTVVAENAATSNPRAAFSAIERLAYGLANRPVPAPQFNRPRRIRPTPPRLTEDWFC